MRRDEALLLDVIHAAEEALRFKGTLSKSAFFQNRLVQSGVLHQLIIIGEAVKRLTMPYRQAHPNIPWKLIAGMRDRVVHDYFEIDLEEVWNTLEKDLPALLHYLKPLVSQLDNL